MRLSPKFVGDSHGIQAQLRPPRRLFGIAMHLAMVGSAERHRKFVADFAAERPGLGEAQVMGVGRLPRAYQARLGGYKLPMELVAQSARFGRNSVVLEIWEVCGGPVRAFSCTGGVRSDLGL